MVKEEREEEEKEKSSLFPMQWTNFKGKSSLEYEIHGKIAQGIHILIVIKYCLLHNTQAAPYLSLISCI